MTHTIHITAGSVVAEATLNETKTAQAIVKALPLEARANTWGDEVYFSIPVQMALENGQEVVEAGDMGYWPPGHAFCIFFGPTPASVGDEIRPASAVTVVGRVKGDARAFKGVKDGAKVRIEKG